MASKNEEESSTPGSSSHVEPSTDSTAIKISSSSDDPAAPPAPPPLTTAMETDEDDPVVTTTSPLPPSTTKTEAVSAKLILTEENQIEGSEYRKAAKDLGGGHASEDSSSVVSMPVVSSSTMVEAEGGSADMNSDDPDHKRTPSDGDNVTVASAPTVVVGGGAERGEDSAIHIDSTSSDIDVDADMDGLDEYIRSPQGQNAIAERSPGGRYIRFHEKLGSGASKDVYRAYDTQEGIEVAWNVVNLAGVPKNERNRIVNEVRLLERLHHQNIISFHGSWVNRERQEVNFVTEILSSGTLKSFIDKVQVIRWKIAKRWALQILKGLEYLHSQDPPVIHRDLKCQNIFINGTSGDLRIGDLGLSTVHRNGKVLSVLGTPEFMAPDMYEENSYDEKVDVYAFGMVLLEIFTKEIPYSECSNPAQIYKKVSRGEPPESLSRIKSRHAREFIELCLGYKDDGGKYIRPTVAELLAHEFLLKRPDDDDEVEVEPPLQERVIREGRGESSSPGSNENTSSSKGKKRPTNNSQTRPIESMSDSAPPLNKEARSNSLDEDESDRFEEMPDSEVNIRKVKVLIGRGQELQEDEDTNSNQDEKSTKDNAAVTGPTEIESSSTSAQVPQEQSSVPAAQPAVVQAPAAQAPTPPVVEPPAANLHYLVAAAVIENEAMNSQPYADDILKLVVTLPVEGQTQNVQFDFHLVEDDPVQVAKEMVAELGIPQAAVLEISETISGLARAARIKQDKYIGRSRAPTADGQQSVMSQPQHQQHPPQNPAGDLQPQGGIPHQQLGQGMIAQAPGHQPLPDYGNPQQMVQPQIQQHNMHQQMGQQHVPIQQVPMQHMQTQQGDPNIQQMPYGHTNMHVPSQHQPQPVANNGGGYMPIQHHQQQQQHTMPQGNGQPQQQQPTQQQSHQQNMPPQQQNEYQQPPQQNFAHANHPQSLQRTQSMGSDMQQQQHAAPAPFAQPPQHPAHVPMQGQPAPGVPPQSYGQPSQHQNIASAQYGHQRSVSVGQQMNGGDFQTQQPGSVPVQHQGMAPQYSQQNGGQVQQIQQQQLPGAQQHNMGMQGQQQPMVQQQQMQPQPVGSAPQNSQQQGAAPAFANPPSQDQRGNISSSSIPPQVQQTVLRATSEASSSGSDTPPSKMDSSGADGNGAVSSDSAARAPLAQVEQGLGTNSVEESAFNLEKYDDENLDDQVLKSELRKLDEDFKKNMMRAKKVFVNRMDNLQRTQYQREEQHQKTLEKHEKERMEFEKRMQQEEIEQNRRIEQLQKEWDKRRDAVRQKKTEEAIAAENKAPSATNMTEQESTAASTKSSEATKSTPATT